MARSPAGPQSAAAKNNLQVPETTPSARALGKIITEALGQERAVSFRRTAGQGRAATVQPLRTGMTYGTHVDNALRLQHDGGRSRTDMSCTVFLTDPADYDGGELVVEDTYGWHAVKLAAGDAILYSSTSQHRVNPITRGRALVVLLLGPEHGPRRGRARACCSTLTVRCVAAQERGRYHRCAAPDRALSQPVPPLGGRLTRKTRLPGPAMNITGHRHCGLARLLPAELRRQGRPGDAGQDVGAPDYRLSSFLDSRILAPGMDARPGSITFPSRYRPIRSSRARCISSSTAAMSAPRSVAAAGRGPRCAGPARTASAADPGRGRDGRPQTPPIRRGSDLPAPVGRAASRRRAGWC